MKYEEARQAAQVNADAFGYDFGVERNAFGYTYFMLPRAENRCGHELRCEVVHPTRLENCQPGHGPLARRVR